MPHIILEHSNNVKDIVNYQAFFKQVTEIMLELEIVPNADGIKSRFIKAEEFYLNQEDNIYIHLQLSLLKGRDKAKLQNLGKKIKELMQQRFSTAFQEFSNSFSVEIREIDSEIYQK